MGGHGLLRGPYPSVRPPLHRAVAGHDGARGAVGVGRRVADELISDRGASGSPEPERVPCTTSPTDRRRLQGPVAAALVSGLAGCPRPAGVLTHPPVGQPRDPAQITDKRSSHTGRSKDGLSDAADAQHGGTQRSRSVLPHPRPARRRGAHGPALHGRWACRLRNIRVETVSARKQVQSRGASVRSEPLPEECAERWPRAWPASAIACAAKERNGGASMGCPKPPTLMRAGWARRENSSACAVHAPPWVDSKGCGRMPWRVC